MRIIFDSNIYLAALKRGGLSHKILEFVFERESGFFISISPDLKSELFEKLERWEQEKLAEAERIHKLKFLVENFIPAVIPEERIDLVKSDPEDNKVLECAVAADANLIITMDQHLLKLKQFLNIPIVHPKTFSFMLPKG